VLFTYEAQRPQGETGASMAALSVADVGADIDAGRTTAIPADEVIRAMRL